MITDRHVRYLHYSDEPASRRAPALLIAMRTPLAYVFAAVGCAAVGWGLAYLPLPYPW